MKYYIKLHLKKVKCWVKNLTVNDVKYNKNNTDRAVAYFKKDCSFELPSPHESFD